MTTMLTDAEAHPETVPSDEAMTHIACVDCYGWDLAPGEIVISFCGFVDVFAGWCWEPIDEGDCPSCQRIATCPVCGKGVDQ
jgi:hypothetical protein